MGGSDQSIRICGQRVLTISLAFLFSYKVCGGGRGGGGGIRRLSKTSLLGGRGGRGGGGGIRRLYKSSLDSSFLSGCMLGSARSASVVPVIAIPCSLSSTRGE
jgi:hypothetical protein